MDAPAQVGERIPIDVILYTTFRIITGVLRLPRSMRLSDRLNASGQDFVALLEPRIIDLQKGWMESMLEEGPWYVHRQEILIVHEVSTAETRSRVLGVPEARVPTQPTAVRAYVGPFRVEGDLYLPLESDLVGYLNHTDSVFFPMTSVLISLPGRDDLDVVQVAFALVNQTHLAISRRPQR